MNKTCLTYQRVLRNEIFGRTKKLRSYLSKEYCFHIVHITYPEVLYCAGALNCFHPIELFLSLTTSANATYSKLIPAFQQLCKDLSETETKNLLILDESAFSSVSGARFNHTNNGIDLVVAVVVITSPLPRDGGTARTAIQVHAVNLI